MLKRSNPTTKKKMLFMALTAIILLVLGLGLVKHRSIMDRLTGKTSFPAHTASQATKGEPAAPTTPKELKSSNPSSSAVNVDTTAGSQTEDNIKLDTPTGTFVSNHHPNLSGSPAPNHLTSICTTTSGATCTITFTKDGVTKSLQTQTTDRGGSVYWDWKLQDIGLTSGSWKVTAVAKLGTQTKTAQDSLNLEVEQ